MKKNDDNVNDYSDAIDEEIAEAIHGLRHAYRGQHFRVLESRPYPLAPMEGRALNYVAKREGATQSELAIHWGRDKAQVARLIQTLRDRDLVTSVVDGDDKRIQRLSLTATGQIAQKALQEQRAAVAKRAVSRLKISEKQTLLSLLERIKVGLADQSG
jgi:DNA-binding MarR family transcriptional regulator